MIFLQACHNYLKQVLILKNQLKTTNLELEKTLQSNKRVKTMPPSIMIKKMFMITNINLGLSKPSTLC